MPARRKLLNLTLRERWRLATVSSNIGTERLLYCDFLDPNADPRIYQEVEDINSSNSSSMIFEEHNAESKSPMPLVRARRPVTPSTRRLWSFNEPVRAESRPNALTHAGHVPRRHRARLRIAAFRQPQGNALLLGVGGAASPCRMATYEVGGAVSSGDPEGQ